jgi:hypothetical protein
MTVQNIDFLPPTYLQNRIRRRKTIWHRGAAALFLAGILAGSVQQYRMRLELQSRRDRVRQDAERMTGQLVQPAVLQKQIERLDAQAELITFLKVRVPPTRILAALSNHLPEYVSLTRFEIKSDALPALGGGPPKPPPAPANAAPAEAKLPERVDFEKLKAAADGTAVFVIVDGIAPDDISIALWLSALQHEGLFSDVKLLFTEEHQQYGHRLRQFGLRLAVRQPGRTPAPAPAGLPASSGRHAITEPARPSASVDPSLRDSRSRT